MFSASAISAPGEMRPVATLRAHGRLAGCRLVKALSTASELSQNRKEVLPRFLD